MPEFSESDPGWVRLDVLRAQLGIKHAQMQRIRKQLGNVHEHSDGKPGQPVWIFAPLWWRCWARNECGVAVADGAPSEPDYDKLFAKAKYERFIGELVPIASLAGLVDEVAPELADALERGQRIDPEAIEPLLVAIDSAKEKLQARFNGHSNAILQPQADRDGDRPARKKQAVPSKKITPIRRRRNHRPDRPGSV